ncbi:Protein CBG23337 [Caenorhabditis briggsae]|uniref:Protein CBG23337 n=1 Tax=Caenorhabditis briggsae TaxID=6238 RepID=A8Y457_CAEBR|nr:Protein CBG23337 [Caenorhabditis briggsae]CAP39677.2 Protein CBG23337 [Caenorhabditis briggsae]
MSNDTNIVANRPQCDFNWCGDFGTCIVLNPGETTEWYECICGLWQSGQDCQLEVPLPVVKKIHQPKARYRFADYLQKHQKFEKLWLKSKLEEDNKKTGKTRNIPYEEETDQEHEKQKKEKKEEEEKNEEVVKPQKPVQKSEKTKRTEELSIVQEEKKLGVFKDPQENKVIESSTKSTKQVEEYKVDDAPAPSTRSDLSSSASGGMSGGMPELPADAPDDCKKHHEKEKLREKQNEAEAERKSIDRNKPKKSSKKGKKKK